MGVRRNPDQYNWSEMEFNEELLLPRNFTAPRKGTIQFFVIHHMIVLNRDSAENEANRACYDIWINQGREASANYGVDGDFIDQFVYDGNAAWGNGNYWANHNSIVVEHANKTLDLPGTDNDYVVDERTFYNGAKLVAYGHHKYGLVPTKNVTIRQHREFYATACPGPYMIRHWDRYCQLVHDLYHEIKNSGGTGVHTMAPPLEPQRSQPQPGKLPVETIANEVIQGVWGNGDDRMNRLRDAGYNADEVQAHVNNILAGNNHKSVTNIAWEVIAGHWGNGQDRMNRLEQAGHNSVAVQAEVNRLLG